MLLLRQRAPAAHRGLVRWRHSSHDAVVVGGGLAGIACATALARQGVAVALVEQGRGLGGRVCTRKTECGAVFDHGAQYFNLPEGHALAEAAQV